MPDVMSDRGSAELAFEKIKFDKNYLNEGESNLFLDRPLPSDREDVLFKYDTSEDA